MRVADLFRISVRQVFRQRRRNLGVGLAMALGTAGFIMVVTMGEDVKMNLNKDLELLGGATVVKAYFEPYEGKFKVSQIQRFSEETLEALRTLEGVESVSVTSVKYGVMAVLGSRQHQFHLLAVDQFFWQVNNLVALQGRLFEKEDIEGRRLHCILGAGLARTIFGDRDPVGELLTIERDVYRVVGILGGAVLADRTHFAFLPVTTAQDRILHIPPPDRIYVRCATWEDVAPVSRSIPASVALHQRAEGLRVEVAWERLRDVKRLAWWIETFVHVAVVATLVLGGFGIWNVTMAAVRARTREIGLKKAMGAKDREILAQFLTEAVCLSVGAAVMGVGLGWAGMEWTASLIHSRPSDALFHLCITLALGFALVLGVAAGLYPSVRASRMEVMSALRYE
jgi:putative ABC transport system permease protein